MEEAQTMCTAFAASRRLASGSLATVARKVKETLDQGEQASVLIFDDSTSELIELDFRGTMADVMKRLEESAARSESAPPVSVADKNVPRGPGRPKLGVIAREVTLLPRHWEWLNCQPGGASVALRKLVEEARRVNRDRDKVRQAQEAAYRFMSAMAGNLPGFEEATRALFVGRPERFNDLVASWPADIRDHARKLSTAAFPQETSASVGSEEGRSL